MPDADFDPQKMPDSTKYLLIGGVATACILIYVWMTMGSYETQRETNEIVSAIMKQRKERGLTKERYPFLMSEEDMINI